MSYTEREADRLRSALLETPPGPEFDRLHSAQQALVWAADPLIFRSPYDSITCNPGGSKGCPLS